MTECEINGKDYFSLTQCLETKASQNINSPFSILAVQLNSPWFLGQRHKLI